MATYTIKRTLFAITLSVIAVGCVREADQQPLEQDQENLHEVVFHAGWAPETKTVLQEDGSVWWSPGDEISLFVGNGGNGGYKLTSTNTAPSATVDFVGMIGGESDIVNYIAVYPYNQSNGREDDVVYVTIPSEQIAKEGAFAEGALVSVAISTNENLFFKNICSGVKFSVANSNINKVVIKSSEGSNFISGTVRIDISDPNNPSCDYYGSSSSVTITAPDGGCFKAGKYYYVSIMPGEKTNGLDVEYYTTENTVGMYTTNNPPQPDVFSRAVIKRFYEKDKGLTFHTVYQTKADFYPYFILPEGIDKTSITKVSFLANSDKTTDITIPSEGAPIYFEMIGTTATYYTSADVYNLLDGQSMFYGWKSLEAADLSLFCTDKVQNMTLMFAGCKKLKSLNLSSFVTDNVKDMTCMFEDCRSLESLDLRNFSSLGMVGRPQSAECFFRRCYSLTKIDLGGFDLSACGTFGAMMWLSKYSKNCAIRCNLATRNKLSDFDSRLGSSADYITWVLPEEELPDLEPIIDPSLYKSTDFSKDKTARILHKATKGNGVDIVLLGDAYSDRMIADGTYDADMELAMNAILKDEPYASFKDYINVYAVYAVSENEIPFYSHTVFDASINEYDPENGLVAWRDNDEVYSYASIAVPDKGLEDVAMILIINQTEGEGYSFTDGAASYEYSGENPNYAKSIGMINRRNRSKTESFSQIVAHEFGHVFAKLGDEYIMFNSAITDWEKEFLVRSYDAAGWWNNVDVTSDSQAIKWHQFLEDSRYAGTGIGIYEGGYTYAYGVWHPTANSIMNNNQGMFNAPSREAIYKRVHKLALGKDWQYDYETFVEYDQKNIAAEKAAQAAPLILQSPAPEISRAPFMKIEKTISPDGKERISVIMN